MKPNSLYISDLDGTLLQNDATLSSFAARSLTQMIENGMAFTIASARGTVAIKRIMREVPIALPVISANGAFLSDFASGKHLHVQAMPGDLKMEVYEVIQRHRLTPIMSTYEEENERIFYVGAQNEGIREFEKEKVLKKDPRLKKVDALHPFLSLQVIHFTIIDQFEPLRDLKAELMERFPTQLEIHFYENVYNPGWFMCTILDRRATKSEAIRLLIEREGFGLDQVTVFGDNLNDLDMFRLAQNGVAVSNARQELKEIATRIIGPNHDDSVVKYLQHQKEYV